MSISSDQLADLLVPHFSELDMEELGDELELELPIEFDVENPDHEILINVEATDWTVQIWPFGESETSIDRGDACREELLVDVYVHGPLNEVITRQHGVDLVRALRYSLRGTEFEGFRWEKNETVNGVFDAGLLKSATLFVSMFRATFFNFG